VTATACTLLALSREQFQALLEQSPALQEQVRLFGEAAARPRNARGESDIAITSGHSGELMLPGTFADYELAPREYELSVAQTVLRVHSRVADLYKRPDESGAAAAQAHRRGVAGAAGKRDGQQPGVRAAEQRRRRAADPDPFWATYPGRPGRTAVAAAQHQADVSRTRARSRPSAGNAASGASTRRPSTGSLGVTMPGWRGVPIFPCNKIPVTAGRTSSIIAMRIGEDDQGVVGLNQVGIPDEFEPGLNVRFMGISDQAVMSYLVSAYFSVAVLVPDALGVLENVEVSRPFS